MARWHTRVGRSTTNFARSGLLLIYTVLASNAGTIAHGNASSMIFLLRWTPASGHGVQGSAPLQSFPSPAPRAAGYHSTADGRNAARGAECEHQGGVGRGAGDFGETPVCARWIAGIALLQARGRTAITSRTVTHHFFITRLFIGTHVTKPSFFFMRTCHLAYICLRKGKTFFSFTAKDGMASNGAL